MPARTHAKGRGPEIITVSALTGEGLPDLLAAIEERVSADHELLRVELAEDQLGKLHHLYDFGEVLDRQDREDGSTVALVRVPREAAPRFRTTFPTARAAG